MEAKTISQHEANELRQTLDELLGVFLRVAPAKADVTIARRAHEVLCRIQPPAGLNWRAVPAGPPLDDWMITGSD